MTKIYAHRGFRGLYPENTLLAFEQALALGVDVLEMDVCISKDLQVFVSHEPWLNHELISNYKEQSITAHNERQFNLFELNYDEIRSIAISTILHPRFPLQQQVSSFKPLLSEVFEMAEAYSQQKIAYSIELKYVHADQGIYHPTYEIFYQQVEQVLKKYKINERAILQCFEPKVLQYIHQQNPQQKLSYLVEDHADYEKHLQELGFTPFAYSPDFSFVNEEMKQFLDHKNIALTPWTVNELEDMKKLIDLGVEGIISDYPNALKTCLLNSAK
jgi:glycerophosphoryl diester phosphodiesterase